jgi:hypothetical protein
MPIHATAIDTDADGDADVIAVVQGTNGTSNQIRSFNTTGTLLGTLNGFVGPWNIATLAGLDPNLTAGFTITLDMTGLTANQQTIFIQAAARWSQIIVGDLPNATYQGRFVDDVLIAASSIPIDGPGNTLGQANWDERRPGNGLPFHGVMQFDTADIAREEQEGTLLSTVIHEIGHVLGFGTLWDVFGLLVGAGTANPIFTGSQATAAYNQVFSTTATGVPVHNADGPGSRDSHWLESLFQNELMTPFGLIEPLSRITVASLADLGYSVNMAAADPYSAPGGGSAVLAQSSNSGGNVSSASRFYSRFDTAPVSTAMETLLPLQPTAKTVAPVRRSSLTAASTRFEKEVLDVALTAAYQRGKTKQSDDVFERDEEDVVEFSLVSANDQFFARLGRGLPHTNATHNMCRK